MTHLTTLRAFDAQIGGSLSGFAINCEDCGGEVGRYSLITLAQQFADGHTDFMSKQDKARGITKSCTNFTPHADHRWCVVCDKPLSAHADWRDRSAPIQYPTISGDDYADDGMPA